MDPQKINRKWALRSKRCLAQVMSIVGFASSVGAQGVAPLPDPSKSYDINVFMGTLLPSRFGLTEIVPGWGVRYSAPTGKGLFEASGYFGRGNGAIYRSAAVDYRIDVTYEALTAQVLLGLHVDQFEASEPNAIASRLSGGWHYGGGITQWIAGPIYMRGDFRHRFSPGQVLEVTVGLTYRYPADGR